MPARDLRDAQSLTSEAGRLQMVELAAKMQRVFAQLEAMPMVTVAQIEGAALGGGFELALACDLRVVADTARIGLPEAGLGLLPGAGGTQRLTRLCGDAVARRMILSAEVLDGVQAAKLAWCIGWQTRRNCPVWSMSCWSE